MRVRRVLLLVVLLLVVALAAIVLTTRPDLDDAKGNVEARFAAVAVPLEDRYETLTAAVDSVRAAPGPVTELVSDLDTALNRWDALRGDDAPDGRRDDGNVAEQVEAANALEALGRRLATSVRASARLSADAAVTAAVAAFVDTPVPEPLAAFDGAVRAYEEERGGPLRRLVADVLGYEAISTLDIRSTSP